MPPRWSPDDDHALHGLYARGVRIRMIAEELGRSPDAVSERRRALGIAPRPRARPWSPGEDELLRAVTAAGLPVSAVAARLRRPPEQVRRRRRALLGPRWLLRPFEAAEDEAIATCFAEAGDVVELAGALGRSVGSVRLRAQKLALHRPGPRPRWREHEDAAVRDGYELGLTCAEIATELPSRTTAAIAARAAKLGLVSYARRWTPTEDQALMLLARDSIALERAALLLARTPDALRSRARKLGITPPQSECRSTSGRPWTESEHDLLRLHRALNPATLARMLDRSPGAITQRVRQLGLREGALRSPHHPVPARSGLTPGQRTTIARELQAGGPARRLAVARRLEVRVTEVRDSRTGAGQHAFADPPDDLRRIALQCGTAPL
jgi:hypothetical protein